MSTKRKIDQVNEFHAVAQRRRGAAQCSAIRDEFCGDNKHLKDSIKALISLSDDNALVPHGIGGHARNLLAACYHRLPNKCSS